MKALVTGAAGFIGSHLSEKLLANGWTVTALDNFDNFYDPKIKRRNMAQCLRNPNFSLIEGDVRDGILMDRICGHDIDVLVHLAAKAGALCRC